MKVIIDRIEGDIAVLSVAEYEELSLNIPCELLPPGVKSGDHLKIEFTIDHESRAAAETRAKDLLKDLTKNSDPTKQKFKL